MKDELEATPEENAAAESLRTALEAGSANEDADFARALAMAHADPAAHDLGADENAALVDRAFATAAARAAEAKAKAKAVVSLAERRSRAQWLPLVSVGGLALAAAAAVLLVFDRPTTSDSPVAFVTQMQHVARSTEPLFTSASGLQAENAYSGSARIDRIARARESEFLEARMDAWQQSESRR